MFLVSLLSFFPVFSLPFPSFAILYILTESRSKSFHYHVVSELVFTSLLSLDAADFVFLFVDFSMWALPGY